jgi:phage gpG-like protein
MSNITPFPRPQTGIPTQTAFDRIELGRIMDLYGRMVAAGQWKDYAIDLNRDVAVFSAFRRAAERPEFRIEKRPALRQRQGMWALIGETGAVLKRGQELAGILAPVERRLMKIVED